MLLNLITTAAGFRSAAATSESHSLRVWSSSALIRSSFIAAQSHTITTCIVIFQLLTTYSNLIWGTATFSHR